MWLKLSLEAGRMSLEIGVCVGGTCRWRPFPQRSRRKDERVRWMWTRTVGNAEEARMSAGRPAFQLCDSLTLQESPRGGWKPGSVAPPVQLNVSVCIHHGVSTMLRQPGASWDSEGRVQDKRETL